MGICCSKKPNVIHPVQNDRPRPSGTRRIEDLPPATLVLGRYERTLRARQSHPYDSHSMAKPKVSAGSQWKDGKFPFVIDQDDDKEKPVTLSWKRPTDYATEIRLFDTTINRYSVKQGQVSDCFFMSTLSAIADHPEYIKQMIPRDAYETNPARSNGVFHCRFWWMGEWIDVYTDDLLPFNEDIGRVYGGHSDDKNVVWVPLMEKALARLCGSYKNVRGDQSKAFVLMTGGLVEDLRIIKRKSEDVILPPETVFARVQQALNSGSTVLTGIDEKEAGSPHLKGLVANHAYDINEALKIQHRKVTAMLLRLRNPWGERSDTKAADENGDWKGRWSYGSAEWKDVSDVLRERHNVQIDTGGEFWVCIEDFYKIFNNIYIADTIPNFDEDGFRKSDQLNKVINILGEWHGETAAGDDMKHKLKNPRFLLIIPTQGLNKDKQMPVVLQIIQEFDHPTTDIDSKMDKLNFHIDVFRIVGEEVRDNQLHVCLNIASISNVYMGSRENVFRHKLSPGKYLLVPNYLEKTAKPPVSRSFCMRVFTATDVECRHFLEYPVAMTGKPCETFETIDGSLMNSVRAVNVFGEWKGETAAGSDPVNRLKNPRFILTIPGSGITRIVLQLRFREDIATILHCRLDVFKIDEDATRNNRRWLLLSRMTNLDTFMAGGEVSYDYELTSGKYLLLPNYMEKERTSCAFCIRILTLVSIQCGQLLEYPVAMTGEPCETFENVDGSLKNQVRSVNVFGEWKGETAAGGNPVNRLKNPRFIITIPENRKARLHFQLRHQESDETLLHCRLDVFKIDADAKRSNRRWMLLNQITNMETFMGGEEVSYDYELVSGNYLLLPNYSEEKHINCAFCIRILASIDIQCGPQTENPVIFIRKAENSLEYGNQSFKLEKIDFVFGEWVQNLTAGGQLSNNSFSINPQYGLSVTGNAPQPVLIDLLQETVEPIHAIGCHIIQIDEDHQLPVGRDVFRSNTEMKTVDGKTHPFMFSSEASGHYMLPPGRYLVLVYADKPSDEKRFALVIAAQAQSKIRITEPK